MAHCSAECLLMGTREVPYYMQLYPTWWCHQMETFSALLALCAGNSPVTGEFHSQRPVTPSFDVFFDLRLNKWLSKQWWGWWFEMPSHPLWLHCNEGMSVLGMSFEQFVSRDITIDSQWNGNVIIRKFSSLPTLIFLSKWQVLVQPVMIFKFQGLFHGMGS